LGALWCRHIPRLLHVLFQPINLPYRFLRHGPVPLCTSLSNGLIAHFSRGVAAVAVLLGPSIGSDAMQKKSILNELRHTRAKKLRDSSPGEPKGPDC
jgi:hypothetical protein